MPTYVYQEIREDGAEGETFEFIQRMSDAPYTRHPQTGVPLRRIYAAPNLPTRYSEGHTKARLSNENVEASGFTKYEKDKVTGRYHKTAGKDKRAPDTIDPSHLKKNGFGG